MIIRRVGHYVGWKLMKILLQLFNEKPQVFFFVSTIVSCDSVSLYDTNKSCEFDFNTHKLHVIGSKTV